MGGALQLVGSTRIHAPTRLTSSSSPPPPPAPPPEKPYGVTIADVVLTANLTVSLLLRNYFDLRSVHVIMFSIFPCSHSISL